MAVERVASRVPRPASGRAGGHNVPEETIRPWYDRGLRNLFDSYLPLASTWYLYDSSADTGPRPIAFGEEGAGPTVTDAAVWDQLGRRYPAAQDQS